MAKGAYLGHVLNLFLRSVQRQVQEMAPNHQHILIILLSQDQDLEAPLILPEVLVQHREIIHALDQDQILQDQAIVHLKVPHQRQTFNRLLDLLHPGQFPNRNLVRDLLLDLALDLQKHRSIHALDRELQSLFNRDPDQDQDQDQLIQKKKSELVQDQDQDLCLDLRKVLVHLQHRLLRIDLQQRPDSQDQDQNHAL